MAGEVVVIGAGLAGLNCAVELVEAGIPVVVLEASDGPGGRVRTDVVDGFRLDRGFQVLLSAYPEAQRALDLKALDLHSFFSGAFVRKAGTFHPVADPFRDPVAGGRTLAAPIGTVVDKARVAQLRYKVRRGSLEDLWSRDETTSLNYLRKSGFSTAMIGDFFRPFLGGVFLEPDLRTSSRMLEFVVRMFASGDAAVPSTGMGAIADQLAARLPDGALRLGSRVTSIEGEGVRLEGGEFISARAVVIASDAENATRLAPAITSPGFFGTACLYYAAEKAPAQEAALLLDAEPAGPLNNAVVISNVSPLYAPPGKALISASTVGIPEVDDETLDAQAREQLNGWWGDQVAGWKLLRIYRIPKALPKQEPPALSLARRPVRLGHFRYVCGDHRENGSIDGALSSGRRAAAAVAQDLSGGR